MRDERRDDLRTVRAAPRAVGWAAVDQAALARLADAGVLTALVDACDAPGVPGRVLARFPDGGACLYQGAEALAFRDRAPYLVRVDRAVLTWLTAPGGAGGLGDEPWGMFVVSDAPFAEQVRHWRGWLTVTPPTAPAETPSADAPWAFRFYDPRLAPVFLEACTPEEVAAFFGPCRSLIVPAWDGAASDAAPDAGWMLMPSIGARRGGAARSGGAVPAARRAPRGVPAAELRRRADREC